MLERVPKTKQAIVGAGAGLAATVVMSGVMLGAQRAGLTGKLPPRKITQRTLDRLGVRRSRRAEDVSTTVAHLGYGAASGALFDRTLRGRVWPRAPVAEGVLFGAAVWLVSYFGWLPALRIMPSPPRDRPGRALTMLVAHVVFGAVLGALRPNSPAARAAPGRDGAAPAAGAVATAAPPPRR